MCHTCIYLRKVFCIFKMYFKIHFYKVFCTCFEIHFSKVFCTCMYLYLKCIFWKYFVFQILFRSILASPVGIVESYRTQYVITCLILKSKQKNFVSLNIFLLYTFRALAAIVRKHNITMLMISLNKMQHVKISTMKQIL